MGFWADIVNLDNQNKTAYLTCDLEYLPGHVGADSQGSLISVTGCVTRRVNTSTTGPANMTSDKFRFFCDGYESMLIEGLRHDGGVAMDLHINGKFACSSNSIHGSETSTTTQNGKKWETIFGMTTCPNPIKIKDGDYMNFIPEKGSTPAQAVI